LVQDAWSVLDHKIKYKKSIPVDLKRRINVLSALFELADREFREIRNATTELVQQAIVAPMGDNFDELQESAGKAATVAGLKAINAFDFLRIAGHFFKDFEFEAYKVDGFVHDILKLNKGFQKSELHKCLDESLKIVRDYRDNLTAENPDKAFSPYTSIRHCLYLYDQDTFGPILYKVKRERFAGWLKESRWKQV
jgi:hypothetical protein